MSVTEFLARHFEARGGILSKRNERIKGWSKLRWQPNEYEIKVGRTTLPAVYTAASNHEAAFNYLKPQATLGEVLGTTALAFAYTKKAIPKDTKLIQGANQDSKEYIKKQGDGVTFKRLMDAKVDILSPLEWLALLGRCSNPQDYFTYPTPWDIVGVHNWEWLGGIHASGSARARSGDDGANLYWLAPLHSDDSSRARSVFRGTPI